MLTKGELRAQLEAKIEEFEARQARHEGRADELDRVIHAVSKLQDDVEKDLDKIERKLDKAVTYLSELDTLQTTTVEVVEDTPRKRNIQRLLAK